MALAFFLAAAAASIVSAQVLTNGNGQLPACAANCALLEQAAQACGGTTTADQGIWSCFCQSGYLASLYTSSPADVCGATCTNANDNQLVKQWYTSNCGTDHGASEHPDTGTTTVVVTSTSTPPVAGGTASASRGGAAVPSTTASSGNAVVASGPVDDSDWWHRHYKWVIMLIALFVGLLAFGLFASWLKRRHDRRADQIRNGFNSGITTRSTPKTVADLDPLPGQRNLPAAEMEMGTGRNSPARTRDAFMPYGYGYSRSESRIASPETTVNHHNSPLQRGNTPLGAAEKGAETESMAEAAGNTPTRESRRVLVRERERGGENEKS